MADKLEDWAAEAKKDGLDPGLAKWAFRLARARGNVAVATRVLAAMESIQHAIDYHLIGFQTEAQRQITMQAAPHPEQFKAAQESLAAATELVAFAEQALTLCQRKTAPALGVPVNGESKKGTRFGQRT